MCKAECGVGSLVPIYVRALVEETNGNGNGNDNDNGVGDTKGWTSIEEDAPHDELDMVPPTSPPLYLDTTDTTPSSSTPSTGLRQRPRPTPARPTPTSPIRRSETALLPTRPTPTQNPTLDAIYRTGSFLNQEIARQQQQQQQSQQQYKSKHQSKHKHTFHPQHTNNVHQWRNNSHSRRNC